MPEYRELPTDEEGAAARLVRLLEEAPRDERHRSLIPKGTEVLETRESEPEGLALELNTTFWELPAGEMYAAAAQIVNTVAALEDGKRVELMQGFVPGEIRDGDGRLLRQPLTRDSFPDLRPWIEIHQPVPGSLVAGTVPVRGAVSGGEDAFALLSMNGTTQVRDSFEQGMADLSVPAGVSGSGTVAVGARWGKIRRTAEIPVRVGGS